MKKAIVAISVLVLVLVIGAAALGVMTLQVEVTYAPNDDPAAQVQPVKLGHSNIYLIRGEAGTILVDAGMPGSPEKLDEVFDLAGVEPESVTLILATHGHLDHIGLITHAKDVTGAPVASHPAVAEALAAGDYEEAVPQNAMGRVMNVMTGILMGVSSTSIVPVATDLTIDTALDLAPYGVDGTVIATPGHSPGSLSVLLESGEALIGDMIRDEGEGVIGPGMYYTDKAELIASLERIAAEGPRVVYLSHGDRIGPEALGDAIAALKAD